MNQNKDRKRDTRAGLERELNIMYENADKTGSGRMYFESRGIKHGANGRLDLSSLVTVTNHAEVQRAAKLRITA